MKKLLLLALLTALWSCRIEINVFPAPAPTTPTASQPTQTTATTSQPTQSTATSSQPVQIIPTQNQRPQSKFGSTTADVLDRYLVTAYVVGGDTLYSQKLTSGGYAPGINKVDIDNFAILIEETGKDQYKLTYSYYHNKTARVPKFTKEVTAQGFDYIYEFTPLKALAPGAYESTMRRNPRVLYEKTVGGGIYIPLAGASGPLDQTTDKEVILTAMPQR